MMERLTNNLTNGNSNTQITLWNRLLFPIQIGLAFPKELSCKESPGKKEENC
jgi:hypothetical protein